MTSLREVPFTEFQTSLDDGQIRVLQVLQGAIGLGVFLFLLVVSYLGFVGPQDPTLVPTPDDVSMIQLLTLIHLVIAMGAYAASGFVFNQQFSDSNLQAAFGRTYRDARGRDVTDSPSKCFYVIRLAFIIRLVMLEVPALFGLVICLLGVLGGVLQRESLYWINALSAIGLILFVVSTLPSRASVELLFREKIAVGGNIG